MLCWPFVVGGAAAVDPIARHRRPPRIQIVAPFAGHAVDDIAVPVHQNGRRRRILAILRDEVRTLAGRRFDQSCREIELRECRLQFLLEIGAQSIARCRGSGFRSDRRPCGRVRRGTRRNEDCWRARSMASVLVMSFFSRSQCSSRSRQRSEIRRRPEVARRRQFALLKHAGMQQFRATARRSTGRSGKTTCPRPFDHEKTNPAQRLRHELRRASVAGAVDPSARPHHRI